MIKNRRKNSKIERYLQNDDQMNLIRMPNVAESWSILRFVFFSSFNIFARRFPFSSKIDICNAFMININMWFFNFGFGFSSISCLFRCSPFENHLILFDSLYIVLLLLWLRRWQLQSKNKQIFIWSKDRRSVHAYSANTRLIYA